MVVRKDPVDPAESTPAAAAPEISENQMDSIVSRVVDAVKGLIPAPGSPGEGAGSGGAGRRTLRDEEDDMRFKVERMVGDLLKKEKAGGENHPAPGAAGASPEPVPAQREGRAVERFFGWS